MLLALLYGALVGLSLGLTGGGGSIFAVPLLVYGLGLDFRASVAVSLAVVGITAAYGAILQAGRGQVLWRAGAVLGAGGILTAPAGAWLGAQMPERLSLFLFAALMAFIGLRMVFGNREKAGSEIPLSWIRCQRRTDGRPRVTPACVGKLLGAGTVSGVLSGIFGVGGGFLIVPSLLLVAGVGIEQALATSLVGIALTAASGFAANFGALSAGVGLTALWFLGGSAAGMTLGTWVKTFVPPRGLRVLFGFSVLGMAAFVVIRNIF